jgi:membrane protein
MNIKTIFTKIFKKMAKPFERPYAFIKDVITYLADHDWNLYSAGLSFYALLSLTPFVVLAVVIGGLVFGNEVARKELIAAIEVQAGPQVADLVGGLAEGAADLTTLSIASMLSFVVLVWSSTNLFLRVRSALHEVWGIEPPQKGQRGVLKAVVRFLRVRLFSALGTVAFGTLFLALLALRVVLTVVESGAESLLDLPFWFWDLVDLGVALVFVTIFVRIVYRLLPDQSPPGKAPWIGGLVTAVLLVLGRTGVAVYLSVGTVSSAYGAAGALVVFLLWAYSSALVFLFGARLTYALASLWGEWPQPQFSVAHGVAEAAPKKPETVVAEAAADEALRHERTAASEEGGDKDEANGMAPARHAPAVVSAKGAPAAGQVIADDTAQAAVSRGPHGIAQDKGET